MWLSWPNSGLREKEKNTKSNDNQSMIWLFSLFLTSEGYLCGEITIKGDFLSCSTNRAVMMVFFGREGGFQNTLTKEPVCEAESPWIHLCRAEQDCWQGNTLGEGQPSTLWLCWRQWHYSNTCSVHASSFQKLLSLPLLSLPLWQATAKTRHGIGASTKLSRTEQQHNNWSGVMPCWKRTKPHGYR